MIVLNSDYINILTLVITLFGLYFAYFQYFRITKERRRHLLKVLDGQLDCLGVWVGSDNGNGYGDELTEEQKFNNALPSKIIYNTGSSPLIDSTTILEAMADVPDQIIGEINQLYYDVKRIESIQNYRNLLTSSDIKTSISMNQKILNYRKENPQLPFHHFLMTYKNDNDFEKRFFEQLVSYGQTLHCAVIGNKNKGACQHWTKIKDWIKKEKINNLKPDHLFICISFVIIFLISYLITTLLNSPPELLILVIISILVTFLLSINSAAITCNYFKLENSAE